MRILVGHKKRNAKGLRDFDIPILNFKSNLNMSTSSKVQKTFDSEGKRICNIENCANYEFGKGMCSKHYTQVKIHGRLTPEKERELHSMSQTSEYTSWENMKQRCYNLKSKNYKNYGGRGVNISDEFKNSFLDFYKYMGDKPSINHSIDRIDVNGNYERGNMRWADSTTQNRNQRICIKNKSGTKGVSWDKKNKKWRASISVENKQINLGRFLDINEAIKSREEGEKKYW